jgi:hypothetical protein
MLLSLKNQKPSKKADKITNVLSGIDVKPLDCSIGFPTVRSIGISDISGPAGSSQPNDFSGILAGVFT